MNPEEQKKQVTLHIIEKMQRDPDFKEDPQLRIRLEKEPLDCLETLAKLKDIMIIKLYLKDDKNGIQQILNNKFSVFIKAEGIEKYFQTLLKGHPHLIYSARLADMSIVELKRYIEGEIRKALLSSLEHFPMEVSEQLRFINNCFREKGLSWSVYALGLKKGDVIKLHLEENKNGLWHIIRRKINGFTHDLQKDYAYHLLEKTTSFYRMACYADMGTEVFEDFVLQQMYGNELIKSPLLLGKPFCLVPTTSTLTMPKNTDPSQNADNKVEFPSSEQLTIFGIFQQANKAPALDRLTEIVINVTLLNNDVSTFIKLVKNESDEMNNKINALLDNMRIPYQIAAVTQGKHGVPADSKKESAIDNVIIASCLEYLRIIYNYSIYEQQANEYSSRMRLLSQQINNFILKHQATLRDNQSPLKKAYRKFNKIFGRTKFQNEDLKAIEHDSLEIIESFVVTYREIDASLKNELDKLLKKTGNEETQELYAWATGWLACLDLNTVNAKELLQQSLSHLPPVLKPIALVMK